MLKLYKQLILTISTMIVISLAFTACTGTRPAAQVSSAPTKAAVVAAQPTPTTAPPTSTNVPATATLVALKAITSTVQIAPTEAMTKPTPAAVKVTPTEVMAKPTLAVAKATPTEVMAKPTPAAVKATPVAVKATPTKVAPKATPAAIKPPTTSKEEVMLMTKKTSLGDILTDQKDMTLYTFKNDKPGESTCYDACAKEWKPVVVASEDAKPTLGHGLTGKVSVIERKDGAYQVTYNGMPLYYYADDAKPGDTKGDGFKGLWHVVMEKSK